ncbi:hemolysin XhlA family protein [Paenibacillus oleatilyticus]|uniref:Hemolysin XhlA family protein n=1 Tax=Paenibacillus oleatilyticus TaxID=2594886 RepID=A0ABV4UZE8_9BACL
MSPQPDETQEILQRLTRVETKLDLMNSARDIAQEALQSTKSAHHRLDRVEKTIFWAATTIIGALIVGAITLIFKLKGE